MKRMIVLAAALSLLTVGCESRTETTVNTDTSGTVTSTVETSTTTPGLDTAAVDTAAGAVGDAASTAWDATKEGARDAAHATGTAMETAGQKIQEKTKTDGQ